MKSIKEYCIYNFQISSWILRLLRWKFQYLLFIQPYVYCCSHQSLLQGDSEDTEATETLVGNAQILMAAVKQTVMAAEAASIKIRYRVFQKN